MGHTPNIVVVLAGLFCGLVEGLQGRPVCGRGKQKEGRRRGGREKGRKGGREEGRGGKERRGKEGVSREGGASIERRKDIDTHFEWNIRKNNQLTTSYKMHG